MKGASKKPWPPLTLVIKSRDHGHGRSWLVYMWRKLTGLLKSFPTILFPVHVFLIYFPKESNQLQMQKIRYLNILHLSKWKISPNLYLVAFLLEVCTSITVTVFFRVALIACSTIFSRKISQDKTRPLLWQCWIGIVEITKFISTQVFLVISYMFSYIKQNKNCKDVSNIVLM